jgi:4-hydroxyphenylpyruvate dioxygenase
VLDAAASAGFTRVGLDVFSARGHRDLRAALDGRGLACSDAGVLLVGEADVRDSAEELARLVEEVGAPVCIAALPVPLPRDVAARQVSAAADVLARAGARAALEFAAYGGLTRLRDAVELCEAVGWEGCGLLIDAWHFFRTDEPWELLRSLDGDKIALVHVDDGAAESHMDPVIDGRFRRLPPGAGDFALADLATSLDEIGYGGSLSVEVLSDDVRERPPAEGAHLLAAALRSVYAAAGATGSRS